MNKKVVILVLTAAAALWFWFLAGKWMSGLVNFSDIDALAILVISFSVLVTLIGLGYLLLKEYVLRLALIFLAAIPLFFFFEFSPYYIASVVLMIWLNLYAQRSIRDELEQRVKINIRAILHKGLPVIVTSLFIMVSFAFFLSSPIQDIAQKGELPSTFNQVIRQVFSGLFKTELEQYPTAARQQVVAEVVSQTNSLLRPFYQYAPPVLAFALFLILHGLSFIFIWLSVLFGIVLFAVLKKIGFVKIVKRNVRAEVLEV